MVGSHDSPEGAVTWSSPTTVDPSTSTGSKVDVTISGKYLALRIQSSTDVGWKLHSYEMQITEMGTD